MKNANEMTEELQRLYFALKDGTIDLKAAAEMNNCVGKMIGIAKVQIKLSVITDTQPNIPFLNGVKNDD